MHMLVGLAAKIQIEIPRGAEGEPCGALHLKVRRGRLVQLGLLVVEIPERHRRPARLEENVTIRELGFAIENMLQVQAGVG